MSIIYCERHDLKWDSDLKSECPRCEGEPSKVAMEYAKKAYQQLPDDCLPSAHIEAIGWCIDEALENASSLLTASEARVKKLESQLKQTTADLETYGDHLRCHANDPLSSLGCDCGLRAALRTARSALAVRKGNEL